MIILNILIIIFSSVIIADLLNKKVEDLLPPVLFMLLIVLYGTAICGKSHHSYQATAILFGILMIFYFIKKRRVLPRVTFFKDNVFTPGFIAYLVIIMLSFTAYSNHFVTVWDDFHYNATFPKDMFYYGTMPSGSHSATFYRSYPPLMQLFFYWGFQGAKTFSEPMMFQYKMFLIYTCMLPIFKLVSTVETFLNKLILSIVIFALPYLFMYELMESLSMDTFMAVLFGYSLIGVIYNKKQDILSYTGIISSLACLTLVKQISPLFSVIVLGTWLVTDLYRYVREKENRSLLQFVPLAVSSLTSLGCWLSWKVFCSIKGNTVYLSDKLASSVDSGWLSLPSYGLGTIKHYFNAIFTCHLNLQRNSLTLFAAVIVSIVIIIMSFKEHTKNDSVQKAGLLVVFLGMIGYLAVLLYTYLYVFEQWEADSLSSIDRYFGTYSLALLYIAVYRLFMFCRTNIRPKALVVLAITLITFPWMFAYNNLIPSNYLKTHGEARAIMDEARLEADNISPHEIEARKVVIVNCESNSLYSRGLTYELIPLVPAEFVVSDGNDRSGELLDKCLDENAYYVYFADRLTRDDNLASAYTSAIEDNTAPENGSLYYFDEDRGIICKKRPE